MALSPSEIIDGLKHLSQTHRTQHAARRSNEWKVFLSTVTLIVLTVAFATKEKNVFVDDRLWIGIFIVIIGVSSVVYLFFIHNANNRDKEFAERAENQIMALLDGSSSEIKSIYADDPKKYSHSFASLYEGEFKGLWSFLFQALIIGSISAVALLVISLSQKP